jgi:putative ATP-dependent endonuclease of OLD family
LSDKNSQKASVILIEEPENHLTYARLYKLLNIVKDRCADKQIILSTHSSFVANKLSLKNLILLSREEIKLKLNELESSTFNFFNKLPGYDTLRLILSKKAIWVEGASDELIVQKAYSVKNGE